jgi:hypothetical protein
MASTIFSKLILLIATVVLLGLGLTTYTQPNPGASGDVHDLISRVLGDREPQLPGPPGALAIQRDSARPSPADSLAPPADTGAAGGWVRLAASHDSAALRAWLGHAVLATSTVHGDTIETTLWRLTLHHSCPVLSRLHATSIGRSRGPERLIALRADCPSL